MSIFVEVAFNLPLNSFVYSSTAQCQVGTRVIAPFRSRSLCGFVIAVHHTNPLPQHTIHSITKIVDTSPLLTPSMLRTAHWMSNFYFCGIGEALFAMVPSGVQHKETTTGAGSGAAAPLSLSHSQKKAVQEILHPSARHLYLYGTTGSGKSEVLLHAAHQVIARGGGVIILLPEISLATQVATLLTSRNIPFALLHSRLTKSERLNEWKQILAGNLKCVVGARSAIFAPVHNLNLVIIDEEQDGAYKSSASPRYHARHIAFMRTQWEGATLVMASATPSLESWHYMMQGHLKKIELHGHPGGGSTPQIQLVSLTGTSPIISTPLQKAIASTVEAGRQVMLLLNRRGFGRTLVCKYCGYTKECSRCSVPMVYHHAQNNMMCHYCGASAALPTSCPDCNSLDISFIGYGTELVEQEVRGLFPTLRIARVDADSVRKRTALNQVLSEFSNGNIDILLGTQMIAKGLNFKGVDLVGIILADTSLTLPDFRAEENTFALITQITGRTGRYNPNGKVIIQSYRLQNNAIVSAVAGDAPAFYHQEMMVRRDLDFPPFSRLIRLVIRGKAQDKVKAAITDLAHSLTSVPDKNYEILGPTECPLARLSNSWRMHLIISTTKLTATHAHISPIINNYNTSGTYLEIDIDPITML